MPKIRVVSGFVPIDNHPRPLAEYSELGKNLRRINAPLKVFYCPLQDCWLYKTLVNLPGEFTHSKGDNPAKNTLAYHIVQHQKIQFMGAASFKDKDADVFVWLDYGIFHCPGVTADVINRFLEQVKADDLALPGCWPADRPILDNTPHWRFCGGVIVCPRALLRRFDQEFRDRTMRNVNLKRNITWEVNDLARTEKYGSLPMRWYQADHNETMFTGYSQ